MSQLRPHPDIDQLRRQARELQRNGKAPTLALAQLAIAREYGFPSWAKLKTEVRRRTSEPLSFILRYVRDIDELDALHQMLLGFIGKTRTTDDRRWKDAVVHFDELRTRMIVALHADEIVGGAMSTGLLGIAPAFRGIGLGRRLLQTAEGEIASRGEQLGTHIDPNVKGFYLRMGYSEFGKGRLMHKGVPLSPALIERRTARWRARVGDLEHGVEITANPKIESLPW